MIAGRAVVCAIAVGVLWIGSGCTSKHPAGATKTEMTQQEVQEYLWACPKGRLIRVIEADLRLPAPSETEAPAFVSESPYWKYKYFHGNMVVMFLANGDRREEANTNGFVYVGEPQVLTAEQYWREIREKTPAN